MGNQCCWYVSSVMSKSYTSALTYTICLGIGHWLFTELLMPALLRAAENAPDKKARVITTSSAGSYLGKLDFGLLRDEPGRKKIGTQGLYAQSKFVRAHSSSLTLPSLLDPVHVILIIIIVG